MIRFLNMLDFEDVRRIARLKPIRDEDVYIADSELLKLFDTPRTHVLGYFKNEVLISWVAYRFGKLHDENIWCIIHMFTSNFNNHFTFNGPDFGPIIAYIFREAEKNGYYSYLYTIPKRLEDVYYKKWKSNKYLPPSGRYEIEDLKLIPANTEPEESWLKRLNGGIRAYDVVVKKRTLKEEFRNDNIDSDKISGTDT